jgi:arylsulfatase A-like enzyme
MYAAFISTMDEKIGLVLKKLDDLGLTDNTIVVFQSDQGFSRETRTFGGGGSAGNLRGSKYSLFEGGVRVPAIISWKGHIPKNEIRHQFAANIDWFPTLADYCGITLPQRKLDGKSLKPVIESAVAQSRHPEFYWQSGGTKDNPQWAITEGDWKLLHNPYESEKNELTADGLMLIDMKTDTAESINAATKHPEIVQRLYSKYRAWINEVVEQK